MDDFRKTVHYFIDVLNQYGTQENSKQQQINATLFSECVKWEIALPDDVTKI